MVRQWLHTLEGQTKKGPERNEKEGQDRKERREKARKEKEGQERKRKEKEERKRRGRKERKEDRKRKGGKGQEGKGKQGEERGEKESELVSASLRLLGAGRADASTDLAMPGVNSATNTRPSVCTLSVCFFFQGWRGELLEATSHRLSDAPAPRLEKKGLYKL